LIDDSEKTKMDFSSAAIVIINYNLKKDTFDCIQSLLSAGANLTQIIVVDNASTDGSVELLSAEFGPALTIIPAGANLGYPHGLNLGIAAARTRGAEWVILLNNDTLFDKDFLRNLLTTAQKSPAFDIFCPLILVHNDPQRIWYLVGKRIPGTLLYWHPYRFQIMGEGLPAVLEGDFAHGAAMMVRTRVFEKIGVFDDSSLIYGDDFDFSWRAKSSGFRILGVSSARMWHKVSLTMNRTKPKTRYLRIRNQIRIYRRYGNWVQLVMLFVFTFFRGLFLLLSAVLKGQMDLAGPTYRGWVDGWAGN
jgi:GT2 family glycosyltransferase